MMNFLTHTASFVEFEAVVPEQTSVEVQFGREVNPP
jgi:hypothetical protein